MKKLSVKLQFYGVLLMLLLSPVFVMPNPIPVFFIQFIVQDQLQQPITDATITLGSTTNAPGDYNFMIEDPGTYPYTVVREGYLTAVGTVTLIEYSFDPIIVNVTLLSNCAFIIHDATGPAGEDILIDVEIINIGFQIIAFQADIILPEGFGYVQGSAFLNPLRSNGHMFIVNILPGTNTLRMLAFSLTNTAFNGDSGIIASFTLTTPDIPGTYLLIPVVTLSGSCPYHIVVPGTVTLTPLVILPGDANCDGAVNVLDVTTTISYILGNNPQPFCFENADVNGDGSVNALDVIGTVNIIMGGGAFTCGVSTITDIDGNVYNTVLIGNHCWMKENLKTTRYRNGISIQYPGTDNSKWASDTVGAYAWFNNNIYWKEMYGALYNWYAVNNANGICPSHDGWHIPSDNEFTELISYIGGSTEGGRKLKSCRTVNSPLGGACATTEHPRWEADPGWSGSYGTDEYGFSALPGANRYIDGSFYYLGTSGSWWSGTENTSTQSWNLTMMFAHPYSFRFNHAKTYGYSVRCVKNMVRTEVD